MVYKLTDLEKVKVFFEDWEETFIYACLQGVMGEVYVTDLVNPASACAFAGCFAFYAGIPDKELVAEKPEGFVIMVPQNTEWARLIEVCHPDAKKVTRYAIKKNTIFDENYLEKLTELLPKGYEIRDIDEKLYEQCLNTPIAVNFVSYFGSVEAFMEKGIGVVAMKDGQIVSGASSYIRYREGIELEVDTCAAERRKYLATACCATLILKCLKLGLYPSWDAQNMYSVFLAEKLGYEFSHEYVAYEIG